MADMARSWQPLAVRAWLCPALLLLAFMALGSAESQGHAGEVEVRELGDGDLVQQGRQETLFGEPLPDHEERLYGAPLRLGEVHQGGVGEHPQGEVAEKAMKMEQTLSAASDGVVASVNAGEGDQVDGGAVLVTFEEE